MDLALGGMSSPIGAVAQSFLLKFCPIRSKEKRVGSDFCREVLFYCFSRIKLKSLAGLVLIGDFWKSNGR